MGYLYEIARFITRLIFWGWFRDIRVLGKTNMPYRRPVIIAATHCNMGLDPLVVGVSVPYKRQVHFWAKNSLFKNKVTGYLLRALGAVPVDRSSKNNADLFKGTLQCLDEGNVITIFPEGTSYTLPHMLELKDGLSWAAMEHTWEHFKRVYGEEELLKWRDIDPLSARFATIVPAGITYLHKEKWRSVVVVQYGTPIEPLNYLESFNNDPKVTVKQLTADIAKAMQNLTVNAPDWDVLNAAEMARELLVPDDVILVENYVKIMQSLIVLLTKPESPPPLSPEIPSPSPSIYASEIVQLQKNLLRYRELLTQLKLSDPDIFSYSQRELSGLYLTLRLLFHLVRFMVELPLFLPGILFHLPVYYIARVIEGREKYEECKAQNKIGVMLFVLPLLYGILFRWLWKVFGYTIAGSASAIALTLTFSIYHVALVDERYELVSKLIASWRMWRFLVMGKSGVEECVELRRECMVRIARLLERGKAEGNEAVLNLNGFVEKGDQNK